MSEQREDDVAENRTVIHFTSGKTLGVLESLEQVREALFAPNFISEYVELAYLEARDGDEVMAVLVQPSSVAYVLAEKD